MVNETVNENNETRLIIQCPFCDGYHDHARQKQKPFYGRYLAHCLIGEYNLWYKKQ